MTPGKIREQLEAARNTVREIEENLEKPISGGMVGYVIVRHELVEAWEALDRAIEQLDQNYKKLL